MNKVSIPKWKQKKLFEKILSIIILICSVVILIVLGLKVANKWPYEDWTYEIFLFILLLCEAMIFHKYEKSSSKLLFICSGLILISIIISFII